VERRTGACLACPISERAAARLFDTFELRGLMLAISIAGPRVSTAARLWRRRRWDCRTTSAYSLWR
jgi:hypothetical protein